MPSISMWTERTAPYARSARRAWSIPPPAGAQLSYLFPFSDQVLYPRTMGVRTAVTELAIEPGWLSKALSVVARTGISHLLDAGDPSCHRAAAQGTSIRQERAFRAPRRYQAWPNFTACNALRSNPGSGSRRGGRWRGARANRGRNQGARRLDAEQVMNSGPFLSRLAAHGLKVEWSVD